MLSGIGTVSGSVAIVVAAFLGRNALKNFRHQKVVERQVEQAEKALTVAYRLKDAISEMRSPMTLPHESEESRAELNGKDWFDSMPNDRQQRYVQSNVFYQRMRHHKDAFDMAFSIIPFAKAYFGPEAEESFRKILKCGRSVRVYADAYARDEGHDPDFSLKIENKIWEGASPDDEDNILTDINGAIAALEAKLLPIIRLSQ